MRAIPPCVSTKLTEKDNRMKLTKAKAGRAQRWCDLDFTGVPDPRRAARHSHGGLLALIVSALAAGARTLRGIESFGDDLPNRRLTQVGLEKPPSDSTFYWLLNEQSVTQFAALLVAQVKKALLQKVVQNDLFRQGVVAMDGKCVWSGRVKAHPRCLEQVQKDGSRRYILTAQRACLVSSSARPVLTQQFIAADAGEADTFEKTFGFLTKNFGRSFEVVTYDAGGASRHNAAVVHKAYKAYVFAIKGNQPTVHKAAMSRLGVSTAPGDAQCVGEDSTTERADGAEIRREVFRVKIEAEDPEVDFEGARALWRVRQTTKRNLPGGTPETTVEDRYFICNRVFSAADALKLARLHWGIENGPNWTMDVILDEDGGSPCETGNGVAVVSWLRLLAYNLLSMWRHKIPPRRDEITTSWGRAIQTLRTALMSLVELTPTLA